MSDSSFQGVYIGVPVVVGGMAVILLIFCACHAARRKAARKQVPSRTAYGQARSTGNAQLDKLDREARLELELEIERRKTEEASTANGSQVWFSRYVNRGRLRHWVLIVNGVKYELRRDRDTDEFVHHVAAVPDWDAQQAKREAALAETSVPRVDGFYLCLIGWTRLSDDELRAVCKEVMDGFGSYRLLWNNCQGFLQRFGDRIISTQALDYPWFREHQKTEYQVKQTLPPPSSVIIQRHIMTMNQMQQQQQQIQNSQVQNTLIQNMQIQSLQSGMQAQQVANMNMFMGPPPGAMGGAGMAC